MEFKLICINARNRPNEIPTSRWVKEGEEYTIAKLMLMKQQNGIAGIKLHEINIDDCFPWTYFRLDRFAITQDMLEKMMADQELEIEYV